MIKTLILTRKDLNNFGQTLPIEEVHADCVIFEKGQNQSMYTAELAIFVDHLDGNGRVKVFKNRRLHGLNSDRFSFVPMSTILPSDLIDDLVCGVLDLSSPRVVLP